MKKPALKVKNEKKSGNRINLFIENKVIVEIKAVDAPDDIHTAQLLTYLKLKDKI